MSKTTSKTSPSLEKREQYQKKSQDTKPQYPTSPGQAQYGRPAPHQRQSRITSKPNNHQILLRQSLKQTPCHTIINSQSLRQQSPTHGALTPNQNQSCQHL